MDQIKEFNSGLLRFIDGSPEIFHCVENLRAMLNARDFQPLSLGETWHLSPGGRYFVAKNQSAIIAFVLDGVPCGQPQFHIIAAHGDSPGFTVKPQSDLVTNGMLRLNTEPYGGLIHHSWLDRPLSLAGRITVRSGDKIEGRLVNFDRDLMVIPDVAIHQNREVNNGMKRNPQTQLLPLLSLNGSYSGLKDLLKEFIAGGETILGWDLFVYNHDKGRVIGAKEDMILSPRLDDLASAYPAFRALSECRSPQGTAMAAVFHNEEIGSMSQQGADSTFLRETVRRIAQSCGFDLDIALANSFFISADNAHAAHPNYDETSDPTHNIPLNSGIVVKHHTNYATDGFSAGLCHALCQRAGVPSVDFACRSDLNCGSTLANISATHVSVDAVDVGLAQWAMHSSCETMGAKDPYRLFRLAETFYTTGIERRDNGITLLP